MSDAYIRLSSEVEDEGEVIRRFEAFIKKALNMLGLKISADTLEERSQKIARAAIRHAKREVERRQYLLDLKLGGKGGYTINFLPDLRIPNTPETETRWREFLETLAAKTRIGTDKETGQIGVLYRDGQWLGNLMLADEVRSFSLIPDIHTVRGDLIARGALKVHSDFTHEVLVLGGMHLHHDILRQDPPRLAFRGALTLYGFRSFLDVAVHPERMKLWGVGPGTEVNVRNDHFEFIENPPGKGTLYVLKGLNVLSSFHWHGESWERIAQERIDPDLFEALYARLHRICLVLGLGADFIAKSVSRMPDNIDRLTLYLVLSLQGASNKDKENPERAATLRLLDGLTALRAPFSRKRVQTQPVEAALKSFTIEDAEQTATQTSQPRTKINEKLIRSDLALVTRCKDEALSTEVFFDNGLRTLQSLLLAFDSEDMRKRLMAAFLPLLQAFDALAGKLDEPHRPRFLDLLKNPKETLRTLEQGLVPYGGKFNTNDLQAELNDVSQLSIKEICRRITSIPFQSDEEAYANDEALLRKLYELKTLECTELEFDPGRVLALLLPKLASHGARLLDEARQVLLHRMARGPVALGLGQRLEGLPPEQCLTELRSWYRTLLAVAQAYNGLTVTDENSDRESERKAKEMAMVTLPPHISREINNRLKRTALLWGLGGEFLNPLDAALADNLHRVEFYLALTLGNTPAAPRCILSKDDRTLVEEAVSRLHTLRNCLDTADGQEAQAALTGLKDGVLERLATIFAKPRHKVETFALRKDRDYLEGLGDIQQTMEKVFVSSGRFLLFANTCMESNEVKRAISNYIKPIYFALAKLGSVADGITTNDLLRNTCDPDDFLNRLTLSGKDKEAQAIEEALTKICAKPIESLVSDLRKSATAETEGELGRDHEFLGQVLALKGASLGTLQLDTKRTATLLLLNLESHLASRVKNMFAAGQLAGRPTKRIVTMILERLKWEFDIIRAYNTQTNVPR
ncbi:MAG: hypothetical protein KKE73_14830 [Proteobacteria bacterium]|nr:hypothetical protein [Pseudomonadota bacterium]